MAKETGTAEGKLKLLPEELVAVSLSSSDVKYLKVFCILGQQFFQLVSQFKLSHPRIRTQMSTLTIYNFKF